MGRPSCSCRANPARVMAITARDFIINDLLSSMFRNSYSSLRIRTMLIKRVLRFFAIGLRCFHLKAMNIPIKAINEAKTGIHKFIMNSLKDSFPALPIMMWVGSPISVSAPPTLDIRIS